MTETITSSELKFQIPKRMKYRNVKTVIDDITFDSKKEASYYGKLKLLVKSGDVLSFERKVRYKLIVNGQLICTYVSDFDVVWKDSGLKVTDVKGVQTPMFKIKSKLMKAIHGIDVFIV